MSSMCNNNLKLLFLVSKVGFEYIWGKWGQFWGVKKRVNIYLNIFYINFRFK